MFDTKAKRSDARDQDRAMKVLHIITGLHRAGAETMLARLVPRLGFPNVVVSLMGEGELASELREAGVPVYELGIARGRVSLSAILRLWRIIRREKPQLLQTWLYHADLLGLLVSFFTPRMPLVWNLRCSDMDLSKYSRGTRAVRWLLARASRLPSAIVVNSEAGRRYHEALGYRPRRWAFIPNGFDTESFHPDAAARATFRAGLGMGDSEKLIGMVARVDPMKDHANFLAAAARIATVRPDAWFLLVGRGTQELAKPAALAGRVHALGERSDVATILPALDVFVLSSAFGEGFPNVIGEAMACGVPCVATEIGDTAAIIAETGAIVPPRNPEALCDGVLAVLARGASEGAAARQRILDHYGIAAVASRYRTLYESLIT
jgi:glycosyltransferase involved in cell wall biosynthesis